MSGQTRSPTQTSASKTCWNQEGRNILEFVGDLDQRPALVEARRKLFEAREKHVHPGRDKKVLTSWNGLMLTPCAEAARSLSRDDYPEVAVRNADFLLREVRQENSRLLRTWKDGEAKLNGYLEDYAYLIEGLLELYQTTFDPRWFVAAQELVETMLTHFQTAMVRYQDDNIIHPKPFRVNTEEETLLTPTPCRTSFATATSPSLC